MKVYHLSVCLKRDGKYDSFIISAETPDKAVKFAETFDQRVGYCGNNSFEEAVERCSLMKSNNPKGWGPLLKIMGRLISK